MDGEVGVHSEVGKGSTFWLTARLRKSQSTNNQIEDKFDVNVAENLRSTFAGRRVLIAEDDDFNREIATILLEDVGLCVDVAEDGQFAFEMAGKRAYDLILMDIQMPRLDGLSATRQIRKSTTGSEVPIIAMTANAFVEDRVRCIEAGMNGFLTKPIDTRDLYHTLFTQLSSNGIKGVALE
jgi:CheY-like chemotaxis protein